MKFEIDLEEIQLRREQLRVINNQLYGREKKGLRHKVVDVSEYYAPIIVHALEERLKVVQEELTLLRHTRKRDLIHVERLQLQNNLQYLSRKELIEQIDPWISLEDAIKSLIEDFSFGE